MRIMPDAVKPWLPQVKSILLAKSCPAAILNGALCYQKCSKLGLIDSVDSANQSATFWQTQAASSRGRSWPAQVCWWCATCHAAANCAEHCGCTRWSALEDSITTLQAGVVGAQLKRAAACNRRAAMSPSRAATSLQVSW